MKSCGILKQIRRLLNKLKKILEEQLNQKIWKTKLKIF